MRTASESSCAQQPARTAVVQQLLDQVDVCEEHTPAAVPLEAQTAQDFSADNTEIQRACEARPRAGASRPDYARAADSPFVVVRRHILHVCLVLVANHLPARKATHRDNHTCVVKPLGATLAVTRRNKPAHPMWVVAGLHAL